MAKILLVEDDINLQEVYSARLGAEGYSVEVSSDGEAALARAVQFKPDLILLDVMMPKISGFDVLDIIRQTPEVKDTKVIILTALGQEGDKERGEKLGANKYLVKSQITLEDVIVAVKEVIGGGNNDNSAPAKTETEQQSQPKSTPPQTGNSQQTNQGQTQPTPSTQPKQSPAPEQGPKQNPKPGQGIELQPGTNNAGQPDLPADDETPPLATPGTTVTPQ